MKILLAEDNDLNREIADFILENEGITVVNAKDGQEAGMNEHLAKPLDSSQLIEKLKLYASRKQA